jgi:hypothetical protein
MAEQSAGLSPILKQATPVIAARGEGVYIYDEEDLAGPQPPERRVGADDDGRQLPLQLGLDGPPVQFD